MACQRKHNLSMPDIGKKLPPGQSLTTKWPVLHYGSIPQFDLSTWDFNILGQVSLTPQGSTFP